LRLQLDSDVEIIDPRHLPEASTYADEYHALMGRSGVTPGAAQYIVRHSHTVLAALLVKNATVDAMISGIVGGLGRNLCSIMDVIGLAPGIRQASTLVAHLLPAQTVFICDVHVTNNPSAEELVESTLLAVEEIRRFGITPKVALLSHSNFGSSSSHSAARVRQALKLLHQLAPELEADGEMHADAALNEAVRQRLFPNSKLRGSANLLVMPNVDAASISVNLLRTLGGGVTIGPILMGMDRSAHVVAQAITVRGLVNMSAIAIEHAMRSQGGSGGYSD